MMTHDRSVPSSSANGARGRHSSRRLRLLGTLGLANAAVLGAWIGCSGESPSAGLSSESSGASGGVLCTDTDGDGFGTGCTPGADCDDADPTVTSQCYACTSVPSPGCPCDNEGHRADCGVVHSKVGAQVTCGFGETTCAGGTWGECILNNTLHPQGLATATTCVNNPCDPYCMQFPDTADNSIGGVGIAGANDGIHPVTDAGTGWTLTANGPPPQSIVDTLVSAGALPLGTYFYHEMLPGDVSSPDPFSLTATTQYLDVYFLLDTSDTMKDSITALGNAMGGAAGVIQQVKATYPNARFGVGHFHGYQTAPHDTVPTPKEVSPLWHTLNMQLDDLPARNVMLWLGANGTTVNNNSTEASGIALYTEATSAGLYRGPGQYWVNPRNAAAPYLWTSDYAGASPPALGASGPCPDPAVPDQAGQGIGVPCFAPGAKPLTIVMTDNPTENGPGGLHAYGHPASDGVLTPTGFVPGSTSWPAATNVDSLQNGTEAKAVVIDPTTFGRYRGTLTGNAAPALGTMVTNADSATGGSNLFGFDNLNTAYFPTPVLTNCLDGKGASVPEAFFKFTLAKQTPVHFDTWGSSGDMILYVINQATRKRVACNDDAVWIQSASLATLGPNVSTQASIDALLPAGSYTLAVDCKGSSCTQVGSACPANYTLAGGRCYRYNAAVASGSAAESACVAEGAHLVSIGSAAEDATLLSLFPAIALSRTMTGGRQNFGFSWSDATPWSYTNWAAGQPSLQTCVRRKTDGKWETAACGPLNDNSLSYICELAAANVAAAGYFLQVNAMPDAAPVAVPSWQQMVDAQNAIGGKIIGVDVSGTGPINSTGTGFVACDTSGQNGGQVDRFTYYDLLEAARATGSVDSTNPNPWTSPFVFSMNSVGGPCHAGDPPIGTQIVSAILGLTSKLREDVSVAARDVDDDDDFDYAGPPGATPQLTTHEVDESASPARPYGYFVNSVVANPGFTNGLNGSGDNAPGGGKRCNDNPATADIIEQCLPNTIVSFTVKFGVPAAFPQTPVAQIFKFDLEVRGSGTGVLGAKTAIVVVPPPQVPLYSDVQFTRDYSAENVCPPGTVPVWGHWSWTASTPSDSHIDFTVASATTAAGLNAATPYDLVFTNPPGPSALVNKPIGAWTTYPLSANVNTTAGSAVIDTTLTMNDVARNMSFLRVVSKLKSSTDQLSAPTLQAWNLELSCPPDD